MNTNTSAGTSDNLPKKTFNATSIPQDLVEPLRKIRTYTQHQEQSRQAKIKQQEEIEQKINELSPPAQTAADSNDDTINNKLVMPVGERPVSEAILKEMYSQNEVAPKSSKINYIKNKISKIRPKDESYRKKCCKSIKKFFPFLKMISTYQWKEWILLDLASGFSVGMFIIPQALAYSLLANVSPQYGFYSAFFSMVIYFFLGTSNHINMSSQGVVSLLVGQSVNEAYEKICSNFPRNSSSFRDFISPEPFNVSVPFCSDHDANIRIALTLTIFSGVFQLAMGFLRLGWVTIYLADPLVSAFSCGAAFHVAKSQIPSLLGIKITSFTGIFNLPRNIVAYIAAIPYKSELKTERGLNWNTVIVSAVSIIIIAIFKNINDKYIKKLRIPIPIDIIILVISLLLSKFLNWETTLRIDNVGAIKNGFEVPRLPDDFLIKYVIVNAIILAIISYAIGISVSKSFAVKHGYEIDPDQEFVAYGSINFIMSFFSTFVTGSSLGCSSMHESMNGKTQMYSTVASAITLVSILTFATYFETVPKAVVSAIILVNIKGLLFKVLEVPALWRINKFDLLIWLVTFGAVIILDVDIGLGIGVGFSLITVIYRTQKPAGYLMGRIPGTAIYRRKKKHQVEEIVGIKIFKFEGNLYFASADNFRRRLYKCTGVNPKKILERINRGKPLDLQNAQNNMVVLSSTETNVETVTNELTKMQNLDDHMASVDGNEVSHIENVDIEVFPSSKEKKRIGGQYVLNFSYIVLDMSACSFVDSVGIRVLSQIIKDYRALGIEVFFACIVSTCKELFRKAGFYNKTKEEYIFVTVHDAVLAALEDIVNHLVDWDAQLQADEKNEELLVEEMDYKKQIQTLIQQNIILRRLLDESGVDDVDKKLRVRKQSYCLRNPQQQSISSNEFLEADTSQDIKNENSLDHRRQLRRIMLRSNSQTQFENDYTSNKLSNEDVLSLKNSFTLSEIFNNQQTYIGNQIKSNFGRKFSVEPYNFHNLGYFDFGDEYAEDEL